MPWPPAPTRTGTRRPNGCWSTTSTHDLGDVRRLTDDYPAAARAQEQALGIYRDLGDRLGQANALHDLGVVQSITGDYPAAAQAQEQRAGQSAATCVSGSARPTSSASSGPCGG